MKKISRTMTALFIIITLCHTLIGCQGTSVSSNAICPFSTLDWTATYEDMIAVEGNGHESYDSVYGGSTYTYTKDYLGETGIIKYMFDAENKLMCMAWAYTTDSMDSLDRIYNTIHQQVVKEHGESGFDNANSTNYGDVWYLESGDILITAVTTESETALQYAYLNPAVSNKEAGN